MKLEEVLETAIGPALLDLDGQPKLASPEAVVMLLAIGLQESRFEHRRQIGGPARGFWQFECGGGVRGVMTHGMSRDHAIHLCELRNVKFEAQAIYEALERDDVLAAGFARLLLWTDRKSLPRIGDVDAAWDLYYRTWRPGKPHRITWNALYAQAVEAVGKWVAKD